MASIRLCLRGRFLLDKNDDSVTFERLNGRIEICVSKDHRFGTDAFLLNAFAAPRMKDLTCDLGTGCGIIPLLMSRTLAPKKIFALDIQSAAIEQLEQSIARSELTNITPICADLKELWADAPLGQFDVVTCNPPYKADSTGFQSIGEAQKIARHEVLCNINDVCKAAKKLLKFGGRFCLCNRPERLADVFAAMAANNIEPKRLRLVCKTPLDAPWLFLVEGRLGGKPFMTVENNLYIQNKDGGFSEELMKIYGGWSDLH